MRLAGSTNDSLTMILAVDFKSLIAGIVVAPRSQMARANTTLVHQALQDIYKTGAIKTVWARRGWLSRQGGHKAVALNRVSKLVRCNTLTSAMTMIVVTKTDFYRAAFGHTISWKFAPRSCLSMLQLGHRHRRLDTQPGPRCNYRLRAQLLTTNQLSLPIFFMADGM